MNYLLIYTAGLGVTGAAIASAVSYTLSGILMFAAYRRNRQLYWKWNSFRAEKELLRECAKISVPVLGTGMASCLGYVVFAGLVSGMGTTIFAAHSIAVTAETIFCIPGYGLRTAASALVGISLGENDRGKLNGVSRISILMTVGMMCISGGMLYLVSYPLWTDDRAGRHLLRHGTHPLRVFCGDGEHVGDTHSVHVSLRDGLEV